MKPADMHLTPQALESLLFGAAKSNDSSASAHEAQQHLSGCAICQSVAERYRNVDEALKGLGPQSKWALKQPTRGPDCPAEEIWPRLAVGPIKEEAAARLVSHAAECDFCGPLLKDLMEDLAQDM